MERKREREKERRREGGSQRRRAEGFGGQGRCPVVSREETGRDKMSFSEVVWGEGVRGRGCFGGRRGGKEDGIGR